MLKVSCPTIFPFRPHWWHLQPETSVHLSLLDSSSGLLYRGHYQPVNWFPFPIQWPDGIHEMETCMASQYPSPWSQQLLLVEYAHKTLTSSTIGISCLHLQLSQELDSSQSYPSLLCWPSPIQGSHQMAWLLTQDPFEIQKVNNPVAVRHPSLHVSKVKPVKDRIFFYHVYVSACLIIMTLIIWLYTTFLNKITKWQTNTFDFWFRIKKVKSIS